LKTYREEVEAVVLDGQRALRTQDITVNPSTFESVLDASHKAFHVDPLILKKPPAGMELFELFTKISPEPFDGWSVMINQTMAKVRMLPPGAEKIEVANAYGEISNFAFDVIEKIKQRIGEPNAQVLQAVLEDPAATETLRTYLVIPLQRLIVNFQTSSLKVPARYELGPSITDDINNNLEQHLKFLENLSERVIGLTKEKMIWARSRLSEAINLIQKNIRAAYVPGGDSGLKFVITALVGGILVNFIDPDYVPPGVFVEGRTEGDPRATIHILDVCINKIGKEGLRFTDEQIRESMRQRDEKEKMLFIGRFENKNPKEKSMEKMFKKLGLGEYAVGGTKAIYAYNEEQYDKERIQRNEMGFTEMMDGGLEGGEAGYDNAQVQEDDY
jgi:phage gp36-like protein